MLILGEHTEVVIMVGVIMMIVELVTLHMVTMAMDLM